MMAKITFYDCTPTDLQQLKSLFAESADQPDFIDTSLTTENLATDSEIISVFISSKVDKSIIDALPNLKHIACRSTGFDNVDVAYAKSKDINVSNVPSYGEHTVAEYTFGLLLALSRRLIPTVMDVRLGHVSQTDYTGWDLSEKTIGIVGAGRIGRRVAEVAKGFNMKILAYDPMPDEEAAKQIGYSYVGLDELLSTSDVVSLHIPQTVETTHLINEDALTKMKDTAVLINTARGGIVDTKALLKALDDKQIAGAALDVLEGEQLLNIDEELLLLRQSALTEEQLELSMELRALESLPNTIITPHNAFNTTEAINRINKISVENIKAALSGAPQNIVKQAATQPGKLIIARHGESTWNAKGIWTGTRDVHLTEKGFREAAMLGESLRDIAFDKAFTSQQIRALETLEGLLAASDQKDVPLERSAALNERDYGEYTGRNKWHIKEELGEEIFNRVRRDWDFPVPHGETLKQVYERAVPFYMEKIVPLVNSGKNVLIVAHGNSIRTLMKYIETIPDEEIPNVEMIFGKILIYDVDKRGLMTNKQEREIDSTPPPA